MKTIDTDYLVIGAGAVGMAFVDTLLTESDADIVIVDQHHLPGGHWNDAYSFVRLHQPSSFYGVASRELGSGRIDDSGPNKGFFELASGAEVLAYFEQVMRERFLPSGRVRYFPMSRYDDDGEFQSLLSAERYKVNIRRKLVDGTWFKTSVPSMHMRPYDVAADVVCVPPNQLAYAAPNHDSFTIVGGGKTAMDVGVWLLSNGASPDSICWICPRDSWLLNRSTTQPHATFFESSIGGVANQLRAIAKAVSPQALFLDLEAAGNWLRIDQDRLPEMMHFATISVGEVAELRRIENVLRGDRVAEIEPERINMVSGNTAPLAKNSLVIDCTASAVDFKGMQTQPIFEENCITIQGLRAPSVTFSAALTAYVEANYESLDAKNALCKPISISDTSEQWLATTLGNMVNQGAWNQDEALTRWITDCRLDGFRAVQLAADASNSSHMEILERLRNNVKPAVMNLQKLVGSLASAA